jgi:hypothetical protein
VPQVLRTQEFAKGCGGSCAAWWLTEQRHTVARLTLNVVSPREKTELYRTVGRTSVGAVDSRPSPVSRPSTADRQSLTLVLNLGGVDQHNRDIVLNRVHAAAFAAFQAFAVRIQNHRLPANGANQHVEQILRNHRDNIVMLHATMCTPRSEASKATSFIIFITGFITGTLGTPMR